MPDQIHHIQSPSNAEQVLPYAANFLLLLESCLAWSSIFAWPEVETGRRVPVVPGWQPAEVDAGSSILRRPPLKVKGFLKYKRKRK